MGRIVRNTLLHLISLGMIAAAAVSSDEFWQEAALLLAAGAFALAWLTAD